MKIFNNQKEHLNTYEDLIKSGLVEENAGKCNGEFWDTVKGPIYLDNGEEAYIYAHWSSTGGIKVYKSEKDSVENLQIGELLEENGALFCRLNKTEK